MSVFLITRTFNPFINFFIVSSKKLGKPHHVFANSAEADHWIEVLIKGILIHTAVILPKYMLCVSATYIKPVYSVLEVHFALSYLCFNSSTFSFWCFIFLSNISRNLLFCVYTYEDLHAVQRVLLMRQNRHSIEIKHNKPAFVCHLFNKMDVTSSLTTHKRNNKASKSAHLSLAQAPYPHIHEQCRTLAGDCFHLDMLDMYDSWNSSVTFSQNGYNTCRSSASLSLAHTLSIYRSRSGGHSFSHITAKNWNSLPTYLWTITSLLQFRVALKTWLFE